MLLVIGYSVTKCMNYNCSWSRCFNESYSKIMNLKAEQINKSKSFVNSFEKVLLSWNNFWDHAENPAVSVV